MTFGAFMSTFSFKGEWKISVYEESDFDQVDDFVVYGALSCDAEPRFTLTTDGCFIASAYLLPEWVGAEVDKAIVTSEKHIYVFLKMREQQ